MGNDVKQLKRLNNERLGSFRTGFLLTTQQWDKDNRTEHFSKDTSHMSKVSKITAHRPSPRCCSEWVAPVQVGI